MRDYTFLIDEIEAHEIGKNRQQMHPNGTKRFFENPNEENIKGVKVELAFEKLTGIPMNRSFCRDGDGGVDFKFICDGYEYTINVKGAAKPIYLLLKEKEVKICADILVLARIWESEVQFLGWEHKIVMLKMPKKDFGYGIKNYYRRNNDLHKMNSLISAIKRQRYLPSPVFTNIQYIPDPDRF